MNSITIQSLEQAINECRRVHPPVDYVLGPDLRQLATIFGEMIFAKRLTLDIDSQSAERRLLILRWLGSSNPDSAVRVTSVETPLADLASDHQSDACQ